MYITRLELKNFRNYESLEADFDEKINLILGNNAQGKTNLIESIYMTSIGRSFRTAKDSEVIMFGRDEALIKVNAEKKFSDFRLLRGFADNDALRKDYQNMQRNYVFAKEDVLPFDFVVEQWKNSERYCLRLSDDDI